MRTTVFAIRELIDPTTKVKILNGFGDVILAESKGVGYMTEGGYICHEVITKEYDDCEVYRLDIEDGAVVITIYKKS